MRGKGWPKKGPRQSEGPEEEMGFYGFELMLSFLETKCWSLAPYLPEHHPDNFFSSPFLAFSPSQNVLFTSLSLSLSSLPLSLSTFFSPSILFLFVYWINYKSVPNLNYLANVSLNFRLLKISPYLNLLTNQFPNSKNI